LAATIYTDVKRNKNLKPSLKITFMKKRKILLGTALLMLIGCSKKEYNETNPIAVDNQTVLKSADAYVIWKTFIPSSTCIPYVAQAAKVANTTSATTSSTDYIYVYASKTIIPVNGSGNYNIDSGNPLGKITFSMTGGVKYRVSYSNLKDSNAMGILKVPNNNNVKAKDTAVWNNGDGDCIFDGNVIDPSKYARLELQNLVFERAIPVVTDTIQGVTDTIQGVIGTVYVNGHCGSHDGNHIQWGQYHLPVFM